MLFFIITFPLHSWHSNLEDWIDITGEGLGSELEAIFPLLPWKWLICYIENNTEVLVLFFIRNPTSPFWRISALGFLWKEWCWSWNSSTLATSCEELTHWKRLWCWEGLGAGGKGDDRRWDGWMASLTRWTWVWENSWSWWWTGRPGMLRFMGSQRVGHNWVIELNWTDSFIIYWVTNRC